MKKYLKIIFVLLFLYAVIYYIRLPDYIMYSSVSSSMGTYRTTKLYVVVYKSHFNPKLGDIIYRDYCQMNGRPDRLEMKLFYAKCEIRNGHKPYKTLTYSLDEDSTMR